MEKKRVHLLISGRVQGVLFRAQSKAKAEELKLNGWVRNLPDGRVEMVVEGDRQKIEEMLNWISYGLIFARVENIERKEEEYKGEFNDFKIRY